MTKALHLDESDRKLILETKQKLDETTRLMEEPLETVEILADQELMKNIREGLEDVKAGRVKKLNRLLKEEATDQKQMRHENLPEIKPESP